jgi:NADPH-dependent curcumin reductase CurA
MVTSREIRLKSRPAGMPVVGNFDVATVSVPDPSPGEVQVRNLWMTVDPYMRNRMADRAPNAPPRGDRISEIAASNATMFGWRPPFELGEVLQGGAIGKVIASTDQSLRPGSLVLSWLGWREVFNTPAGTLEKLETFGLPVETLLGAAGMLGWPVEDRGRSEAKAKRRNGDRFLRRKARYPGDRHDGSGPVARARRARDLRARS